MAASDFSRLIAAATDTVAAHADELTALDQAIGDGDHGLNMRRGFEAVRAEAEAIAAKPLPDALKAVGTKLVMTVGGASGPLFGTLFMALGKELPAVPDRAALTAAFGKAVEAVAARGKSQPGQKTMLDVLQPVYEALAQGKTATEIADTADRAADATVPMKALRGRASFLGERSIGHM
ncbi:dihydroxyacetone kinase subunit DhaL, partial [Mesorhizobium sp. M1E.F.Ca.ET.041.01.1.1]